MLDLDLLMLAADAGTSVWVFRTLAFSGREIFRAFRSRGGVRLSNPEIDVSELVLRGTLMLSSEPGKTDGVGGGAVVVLYRKSPHQLECLL